MLSTQTVSSFVNGDWLIYNISGSVTFRFTKTHGPNALLSGLFIDPSTAPNPVAAHPNTATLIGKDTRTQGNWRGKYGAGTVHRRRPAQPPALGHRLQRRATSSTTTF